MGNTCRQPPHAAGEAAEVSVPKVNVERLERQIRELTENLKTLQGAHQKYVQENETLEQIKERVLSELCEQGGEEPEESGGDEEAARAEEEEAARAEAEMAVLRESLAGLQEERLRTEQLRARIAELEAQEELQEVPATREARAWRAERRGLEAKKEELEQSLAETSMEIEDREELIRTMQEEATAALGELGAVTTPRAEAPGSLPSSVGRGSPAGGAWALGGGLQDESAVLHALRAERAELQAQCRALADTAERACAQAEQAWLRFERQELPAPPLRSGAPAAAGEPGAPPSWPPPRAAPGVPGVPAGAPLVAWHPAAPREPPRGVQHLVHPPGYTNT
ncbi:unnamed protein product [Prorocentrum cordatum]|uniref:Uncharacterized protein n=1 Tax=Prorocentrum cordatum TaxID=2364126 RepID=A0ABN9W9A4_9DINO|nr:unnamed protein product [Polarella glacialis]